MIITKIRHLADTYRRRKEFCRVWIKARNRQIVGLSAAEVEGIFRRGCRLVAVRGCCEDSERSVTYDYRICIDDCLLFSIHPDDKTAIGALVGEIL